MKQRNLNLDLIRVVATITVLSVHFFLNTSYYSTPLNNKIMYMGTLVRTACMTCVPMFLLLTGYLMNKKELSKNYYLKGGLNRVLIIYIISTIVIWGYRSYALNIEFSFAEIMKSMLKFEYYSWYIEMYIGLYLIIPFINITYNALSYEQKKNMILILLSLTTIPFLVIIDNSTIMPVFWRNMYPITYYLIGAFLCEYSDRLKLKSWYGFVLFIIGVFLGGTYNYRLSNGTTFIAGNWSSWGNMFNVIAATGLFIFLLKLKLDRLPVLIKNIMGFVSKISLPAYLLSYVSDNILYPVLKNRLLEFGLQFRQMPIMVLSSFSVALLLAVIVDFATTILIKMSRKFTKET